MTIYSWNMLYRNRELDRAFTFIAQSDFDVFCLQEVPDTFLARLQTLPHFIAFREERSLLFKKGNIKNYSVILSKHLIIAEGDIHYPDYIDLLPLKTRLFMRIMPASLFTKVVGRKSFYIDISTQHTTIRIFNLHLILMHPALRFKEFETSMIEHDPTRPTIVCGDFNILEKPHITPLNWIMGGKISDALLYRRERAHIETRFVEHSLVNPLYGGVTQTLSQSQLDHILVSHGFKIKKAHIFPDRMGSDHHPILVEVA